MRRRASVALALAVLALSGMVAPQAEAARPPVVMIVLDEFPTDAILLPDGRIDSQRFPGFAALARTSTWFPNASSIYDSTEKAAPAILAGRFPRKGLGASYRDHPRNVFTMLARAGYRVRAQEEATTMCPPHLCPRTSHYGDPAFSILNRRRERLAATIRSLRRTRRPVFTFHHTMVPHVPWIYLPSGQRARGVREGVLPDFKSPAGFHHTFLTQHNEQRFLLQVGYVDWEIRRLLRKLRRERLLRSALLVVTADHGLSFQQGVSDRRAVTDSNVEEIAPVPLFIKAPGRRTGGVDRSFASTIDIVPTMAQLLGLPTDGPVDGRSVYSPMVRRRTAMAILTRDLSRAIVVQGAELERRRRLSRNRRARLLGTGPWRGVFNIGPHRLLLGQRVHDVPGARTRARARFLVPTRLRRINPRGSSVPSFAGGRISGASGRERDLALAVNGRIRATGHSFHLRGDPIEWFAEEIPVSALRRGRNRFTLYEVRVNRQGDPALARLGSTP